MLDSIDKQLVPGARVEIIQQIPHRDRAWSNKVVGVVVSYEQRQTGSWYAHSKNDKLWLDRLMIRKEDGEVVVLNLDDYTHVSILGSAPEAAAEATPGAVTGEMTNS
jgi:hypothetical protein